jgi:hypothetical protein
MALDESVRRFVNQLLEVRPISLSTLEDGTATALPPDAFKLRLLRLWSALGAMRGGVGRVESPGHPFNGFWLVFSSSSLESFNFTDRLSRYQIHFWSKEPVDNQMGVPVPPVAMPLIGGFAQISAIGSGPVPARYSAVSDELRAQLERIPTSGDGSLAYRPCDVILKDGQRVNRVYVIPEEPYILTWGVWPEDDKGKKSIRIEDVSTIEESSHRLPAPLASKLYMAGESGMGYTIFTVVFDDGSRVAIGTGNAIDFIDYPAGKGPRNVVDVLPHVGRDAPDLHRGSEYYWCLYSG